MDHPASGAELPRRNFQPWSSDAPGRRPGGPRIGQARRVVPQGDKGPIIRRPEYLSDHFQNQLEYWGISPSFAFIEQPQTNGVAERFIRTLKEQVIYGRVFQNLKEVRTAVRRFVELTTSNGGWKRSVLKAPGRPGRNGWLRTHSPGRLKKPCVQKTGCGTGPSPSGIKTIRIICPTLV